MVPGIQLPTAVMDNVLSVSSSSSTNNRKSRKRPLRSVWFDPKDKVAIVDRSDHEQTWYTLQDYAFFEQDARSTIRRIRSYSHEDCELGLEKYSSPMYRDEKKMRARLHYCAIFQEQSRQRRQGLCDAITLAIISRSNSKWAAEKAAALAQKYAQEALQDGEESM